MGECGSEGFGAAQLEPESQLEPELSCQEANKPGLQVHSLQVPLLLGPAGALRCSVAPTDHSGGPASPTLFLSITVGRGRVKMNIRKAF